MNNREIDLTLKLAKIFLEKNKSIKQSGAPKKSYEPNFDPPKIRYGYGGDIEVAEPVFKSNKPQRGVTHFNPEEKIQYYLNYDGFVCGLGRGEKPQGPLIYYDEKAESWKFL